MLLAGIGVAVVLLDITLRVISWWTKRPYDLDHNILIPGIVLGFVGFWMIDKKSTKEALEAATEAIPRFGRRKTDASAVPDTITHIVPIPVDVAIAEEKKPNGV